MERTADRGRRRGQRGLALVMVLWAAIILALIAGGVARMARSDLDLARNLAEGAQAELAADSALWLAMQTLAAGEENAWRADGSVYGWRFAGATVRVSVTDEMGRVDLNAASAELLAAVFTLAGAEAADAVELADAIVAHREARARVLEAELSVPDDDPFGEEEGVRVFRRAIVPIRMIEEVARLPGMSPGLWARVAPELTVYTGVARPVHAAASPLVRAALDGESVIAAGDGAGPASGGIADGDTPSIIADPAAPTGQVSGLMRVQAEALSAGGAHFARDAVVGVYDRLGVSYQVRLWQRGERRLFPIAPEE